MTNYRITASENSTIQRTTTAFEKSRSGNARAWTVTTAHEWGIGHATDASDEVVICDPRLGYALGRTVDASFTFDDTVPLNDRKDIEDGWGFANTYGIDLSRWTIEEDFITIRNPEKIELYLEQSDASKLQSVLS